MRPVRKRRCDRQRQLGVWSVRRSTNMAKHGRASRSWSPSGTSLDAGRVLATKGQQCTGTLCPSREWKKWRMDSHVAGVHGFSAQSSYCCPHALNGTVWWGCSCSYRSSLVTIQHLHLPLKMGAYLRHLRFHNFVSNGTLCRTNANRHYKLRTKNAPRQTDFFQIFPSSSKVGQRFSIRDSILTRDRFADRSAGTRARTASRGQVAEG